jgi:predicted nucleic acid-binding protein
MQIGVRALADTGAILAYLDRTEPWHQRCLDVFGEFRLPLSTSSAVLTEFFHMVGDNRRDVERAWAFIRAGAVTVLPISDPDLPDIEALMRKYRHRDRPMDFADGTLVHLAQRESLTTVFTIDHNDFETYRIGGRKRLRILPPR